MVSDGELLRRYADEGSDEAFTTLVQRHINLVYRAALRRVGGNAHSADDVAQRVFTDLARKASALKGRPSLVGWLHTGTRFAAAQVVRTEQRRRTHEQEAHAMDQINWEPPSAPERFEPFLDEVMDLLDDRDRDAILLHYFEGRTFAEVGSTLAMTADAARMRVNRALERLRGGLANRGVTSTAAALAIALATQATQAAPARIGFAIAGHALKQAAARHSAATAVTRIFHAFRSAPLASSTGIVLTTAMVTLGLWTLHSRNPLPPVPVEPARQDAGSVAGDEVILGSATQDTPGASASSPSVPDPSASEQAAPQTGGGSAAFAGLSVPEKNILARLWSLTENQPIAGRGAWALAIGQGGLNANGISPLLAKGWIRLDRIQTAQKTSVSLSKAGRAYCQAHSAEIAAYGIGDIDNPHKQ